MATKLAFETRYSDDSGVEFAVRYDAEDMGLTGERGTVEFEHAGKVEFPISRLDWLIAALERIRAERQENRADA